MAPERPPFVETVATLDARDALGLSDEGREQLRKRVGEPVGPHGIHQMTAVQAAGMYSGSWVFPLFGPLLWSTLKLLLRFAVEPWLLPLTVRRGSPKLAPSDLDEARRVSTLFRVLVHESSFLRFAWRQALVGSLLVVAVGLLTCGLGLIPAWIYYYSKTHEAHRLAMKGEWCTLPWVGERILAGFPREGP